MAGKPDLEKGDIIRYQWMLSRIQGMKSLLVATILAMVGYATSAIGQSKTFCEIILLALSALSLVIALILAAIDAGVALFYNEKSQEGLSKKIRMFMYILLAIAALLILSAKISLGIGNVKTQHHFQACYYTAFSIFQQSRTPQITISEVRVVPEHTFQIDYIGLNA